MNKWLFSLTATVLLGAQSVFAQGIGSYTPPQVSQPTTSPYLNMLSNNPAARYYGIVRPQFQTQSTLQNLQQEIYTTQSGFSQFGVNQQQQQGGIVTGKAVTFMNYSHFFPTNGQRYAGMGMGPVAGGGGIGGPPPTGAFGLGLGTGGVGIISGGNVFNNQGPAGFRR